MAKPRDFKAEYQRRKARGLAAGKTVAQATGHRKPVAQARSFTGPTAASDAEALIRRVAGRALVHLYVAGTIGGVADNWQLFPHGGVRASTLRDLIRDNGGLAGLIRSMVRPGATAPVSAGSTPSGNGNGSGGSGRFVAWKGPIPRDIGLDIRRVTVQWIR